MQSRKQQQQSLAPKKKPPQQRQPLVLQLAVEHTQRLINDPRKWTKWRRTPSAAPLRQWNILPNYHKPAPETNSDDPRTIVCIDTPPLPTVVRRKRNPAVAAAAVDAPVTDPSMDCVYVAFRGSAPDDTWWVKLWCEIAGITVHHVELWFQVACGGKSCTLANSYRDTDDNLHAPRVVHLVTYTATVSAHGRHVARGIGRTMRTNIPWTIWKVPCTLEQRRDTHAFLESRVGCHYDWWSILFSIVPCVPPLKGMRHNTIVALREDKRRVVEESKESIMEAETYTCSAVVCAALQYSGILEGGTLLPVSLAHDESTHTVPHVIPADPCAVMPSDLFEWCLSLPDASLCTLDQVRAVHTCR
jgi:hypothetical protein